MNDAAAAVTADEVSRQRGREASGWAGAAAELWAEIDCHTESGELSRSAHLALELGELLEERGNRDDAESAYRHAVAMMRQIAPADPELMLAVFAGLIHFLAPSEEAVALASEVGKALIDNDATYHPMRAAEAAYHWALAELSLAEIVPARMDHAITGIAEPAIAMLDDVCFHDFGQELQRQIATTLRATHRQAEAERWQSMADRYEDWTEITDQQIPGHVHLWDVHPGPARDTEV